MIHFWGNLAEGIMWIAIAGILFFRLPKGLGGKVAPLSAIASLAFFWFGISDFIEAGTGAWYRPVGLFIMKAACVLVLIFCLVKYRSYRKKIPENKT